MGDVKSEIRCIREDTLMQFKDPIASFRKGAGTCGAYRFVRVDRTSFPLSVAVNIEDVNRVWIWLLYEV